MTTPHWDCTHESALRILGAEAIAEIDRVVAAAPPPTPRQVLALQRIFDVIDADIAREDAAAATRVASEAA